MAEVDRAAGVIQDARGFFVVSDTPALAHDWLVEATVSDLQEAMASGKVTSAGIVMAYLERIAKYDREGPCLNTVLEVNPDAVQTAEALDAERSRSGPRGPLHGIPVLVKDNIDTHDKMHTSAGSRALADSYAPEDSFVAGRLRQAGAVILGKANMTEWANFLTRNMPGGYSSRGGQVLCPYGPGKFSCGGSSSGSGASVAANLVTVAIGTETSGSILSPATCNSVVGIKPTVGLVSRRGIIPIMTSQDTAGPLARTVADAAILLGAIAGVDDGDPVTLTSIDKAHKDYTRFLDKDALKGARLGVPREAYVRLDPDQLALMESLIQKLRSEGATVIDPVEMPEVKELTDNTAMLYEFKPALNAYLSRLAPHVPVHTLRELIQFNARDPERMLKYGQVLFTAADEKSGNLTEPEYIRSRARDVELSRARGIDRVIDAFSLDALVVPGNSGAGVSARAGYPSVCVPGGYAASGQPLGLTFTARAYTEPVLISLAYAFEQATNSRRPPDLDSLK